jgi:hypothetical protein
MLTGGTKFPRGYDDHDQRGFLTRSHGENGAGWAAHGTTIFSRPLECGVLFTGRVRG